MAEACPLSMISATLVMPFAKPSALSPMIRAPAALRRTASLRASRIVPSKTPRMVAAFSSGVPVRI